MSTLEGAATWAGGRVRRGRRTLAPVTSVEPPTPVIPDYRGACVANIVPALLDHPDAGRPWMPEAALDAAQIVVLVVDGLGASQLAERSHLAPTMTAMQGEPITTVAPSTTGAALTSISTGSAPTEHGVVGYRIRTGGETLNVLRWTTGSGDARERIPPAQFQQRSCFSDRRPPVITKREFAGSGFTLAHLADVELIGYSVPSTLVTEVGASLRSGAQFVYAYYDGVDRVGHEYGLAENYDRELVNADRLVADVLSVLPAGAALVVTADHGQVEVGDNLVAPAPEVAAGVVAQSGEARFRWLHTAPGAAPEVADAARQAHGAIAWVMTREEIVDRRILGPPPSPAVLDRLGDVALIPFEPVAFTDPADTGPHRLIGRHGSLTADEMMVPLLVGCAGS